MSMSVKMTGAAAIAAVAFVLVGPIALAAPGGGGGGGGGAPAATPRQDPQADYQAGVAALDAQNYREAIRNFLNARRALPSNGTINYALGLAYNGAGDTDD